MEKSSLGLNTWNELLRIFFFKFLKQDKEMIIFVHLNVIYCKQRPSFCELFALNECLLLAFGFIFFSSSQNLNDLKRDYRFIGGFGMD